MKKAILSLLLLGLVAGAQAEPETQGKLLTNQSHCLAASLVSQSEPLIKTQMLRADALLRSATVDEDHYVRTWKIMDQWTLSRMARLKHVANERHLPAEQLARSIYQQVCA